ncbi:hypothetical protein BP6252_02780 [Coleophoma cylindrospora]|uniref:DUF6536 domain-containing protein n=1 Tax=Coleophoma cylindrospora TaxID=1849047 RepID=A0A3D8SFR6_9HELO|nr:hypothetical protein BP6252_02780 [Coleophoma cylindrospora]
MAYQQYSSWTPIPGGDLGHQEPGKTWNLPPYEDTAYHGISAAELDDTSRPKLHSNQNSYELKDWRSINKSQEPLVQEASYDPSGALLHSDTTKRQFRFTGWKVGVVVCAAIASTVCALNICLTAWAINKHSVDDGLSSLFTGSCTEVARISLWIHLGINAMSTMLLSASNYTMQIISSPTRKEVDEAHRKSKWLDIGIPTVATVFGSFTGAGVINRLHAEALNSSLVRYESAACMAAYGSQFVSGVRSVLLVSSDTSAGTENVLDARVWKGDYQVAYFWICGDGWSGNPYGDGEAVCTLSTAQAAASTWTLSGHKISYCLVEKVVEQCELRFSLVIMLIVIAANAVKAIVMILTVWRLREPTLVTVGDAIASFLNYPDPTTQGFCLSSKDDIQKKRWKGQPAKPWIPKSDFWFKAASVKRWLTCNILCIAAIGFGIWLLSQGMYQIGIYNVQQLYELGFGTVDSKAVVGVAPTGLIATVLFANLPQGILSLLYLTYNGIFTCLLGANEWSLFAHTRKSLRVTLPVGQQRSTYYLQLPYTYSIPLLILSGSLHWLMSQSLFLALVNVYDDMGVQDPDSSLSTVGYSCIAILFAIVVGSVAVVAGIANGFRTFKPGIPLVGSCSAAISAACHRPMEDSSASMLPIQWGVVDANDPRNVEVHHCCFTSFDIQRPVQGQLYAGHEKHE